MPIEDFLLPANAGKQMWQVLKSNVTPGDHPYNFAGLCQALVSQWLLEVRFAAGRGPDELGRHLLQADLGAAGYNGIAKSQAANLGLDVHSGGTLQRADGMNRLPVGNHDECSLATLGYLYDVDDRQAQSVADVRRLVRAAANGQPAVRMAQLSLSGVNGWLLSKLFGATWGHAIGLYSDGATLYVFDPNYGVFTIAPVSEVNVTNFFQDLWARYAPVSGTIDKVDILHH